MNRLGLYIHIPFCQSKCRYCDFCSFPHPKPETVEKYLSALYCEIEEYRDSYKEYNVNTVYFGGGTPTLLDAKRLCELLDKLRDCFNIDKNAEISTECNPKTAGLEYFKTIRNAGINRLSIGVQSMDNGELKMLGRLHSSADSKKCFEEAKAAGFTNISADIMFALPSQSKETLLSTVSSVCALEPTHVSLYGLKIEESTYFGRHKDSLILPDEDTEYEMYLLCKKQLEEHGFSRYEISNFAKDGLYSKHNLKYWHREDYLGLGAAAHSCIGNNRFSNTADMEKYCSGHRNESFETVSQNDILCEKVMLGMRLDEGCDFESLKEEFGDGVSKISSRLENYKKNGYVKKEKSRLSFTDKGMYISNYLLSEVLDFDEYT